MNPRAEHIAFVSPRFAEGSTVGGAETLLRELALRAAASGRKVSFLTTCATNHFSWDNEVPAGRRTVGDMDVLFFPVDENRDVESFLSAQEAICRGYAVEEDERVWLQNGVSSSGLYEHLREHADEYDRIVLGPYLYGLIYEAARISPAKSVLVPCLHDEPFARVTAFGDMFRAVRGFMFNTEQERDLAISLYGLPAESNPEQLVSVVGMGLDTFDCAPDSFRRRHSIPGPYVIYSGRREPLKGTPLLIDYMAAFRRRTGRDIKLVLTGSGPVDLPADLSPHVIDLGFVSEKEKHDAMAGALAFCHPSVLESFGIVILEAWLAGTPAIVHAGGTVLRHHCSVANGGLWFRTYPEFEEELLALLKHPELGPKLGEAGRQYVEREYSWERVEERLLTALDA